MKEAIYGNSKLGSGGSILEPAKHEYKLRLRSMMDGVRQVEGWLRRLRSATEVLSKCDRLSDTCGSRRDWCSGMLKGDVVFRPQRGGVRYDSAKDDVERT
ncbi:hypothetical protein CASFOL_033199 [Castilleja foliolosa]|uniref:Uncharacterized protein n=1 Tax=Castilleja foliolosa TaxID=1961234 RepID=A0ABD3C0S6_9LAMI